MEEACSIIEDMPVDHLGTIGALRTQDYFLLIYDLSERCLVGKPAIIKEHEFN